MFCKYALCLTTLKKLFVFYYSDDLGSHCISNFSEERMFYYYNSLPEYND